MNSIYEQHLERKAEGNAVSSHNLPSCALTHTSVVLPLLLLSIHTAPHSCLICPCMVRGCAGTTGVGQSIECSPSSPPAGRDPRWPGQLQQKVGISCTATRFWESSNISGSQF